MPTATDQRPVVLIKKDRKKTDTYHVTLDCNMVKSYPDAYEVVKEDDAKQAGHRQCQRGCAAA
jgi:hypothetical protein